MNNIQKMAVKITEEIWPVATACLAGGFVKIPFERVEGCYLVINETYPERFIEMGLSPIITIQNCWLPAELFHETYTFVEKEEENKFVAVRVK